MAGARKGTGLETATARLKLKARHHPYWVNVSEGVALGYWRGRGKGSWLWRIYEGNGRYRQGSLGEADDHADANGETIFTYYQATKRAREEGQDAAKLRGIGIKNEITVRAAVEHYLEWFRVARKSIAETESAIHTHILPALGDKKVKDLTSPEIKRWHHKLATRPARKRSKLGAGPAYREEPQTEDAKRARKSTANRVLTVLKAILNKAYEDDLVSSRDTWAKVKPFENADAPIVRFLTQAEAIRLLNASPGDLRAFVRGALLTGARREELSKLTVADVNLANRTIFISGSKSGKSRHVPLSDKGVELFRAQTTGKTGDAFVFTKANGERWGKNHEVRPLRMANEVAHIEPPVSFHELRHTYASLLAQAGADLLTISNLLGHADTRITARHYAHLCDKTLANAVQSHLPSFGLSDKSNVHGLRERAAPALRPADLKAGQKLSAKGR